MSLRTRLIAILLTLFAMFAVTEIAIQVLVVYPRFLVLEEANASRNAERVIQALQRELDLLVPSVNDWALWDDTYAFVQDRNEGYVTANLDLQAFKALGINVIAIYDRRGDLVWGEAYDLDSETLLEAPRLMPERLSATHFLEQQNLAETAATGLFNSRQGLFLVGYRAVLPSFEKKPPMGILLMGRRLDETAIARLAAQAQVDLSATAPEPGQPATSIQGQPNQVTHTAIALRTGSDTISATTTLMDVAGNPVLTLRIATPREISARGRDAIWLASLTLALAGAIVLIAMMVLLRRIVLDPLSHLTAHATALGASDDFGVRLGLARRDEIGVLANAFDLMTERLERTRQRLLEQSYRSGVAEMASGILHNLGNAITPIGVKLTHLRAALRDAPLEEVDLATKELADPTADPQRRGDLRAFIELASPELTASMRRVSGDLEGLQTQVEHVQQILSDQQRFGRAERVIESVDILHLLRETVRVLPEPMRERLDIQLDPDLREMPAVRAARVALQQVVSNLLINAAEAQGDRTRRPESGRVRVSAHEDLLEGVPMIHLRFVDNGDGIPADALPHIFERGFSTKSRGSGMGLHWTANIVAAMGGRLSAESEGPGHGACMHLLLPSAADRNTSTEVI